MTDGKETKFLYVSPDRDLAHCFPHIVKIAVARLERMVGVPISVDNDKFDDRYLLASPVVRFAEDDVIDQELRQTAKAHGIAEILVYCPTSWPELRAWMKQERITREQVAQAIEIYTCAVIPDPDHPRDSLEQTLTRLGVDKVPWQAMSIVATVMSATTTGMFFVGIRHATIDAKEVSPVMDELRAAGRKSADFFRRLRGAPSERK
jgi:hypothetical protein